MVSEIFNKGKCTDITVINELVSLEKSNPEALKDFLEDEEVELTRGTVKTLKSILQNETSAKNETAAQVKSKSKKRKDKSKLSKPVIQVQVGSRVGNLLYKQTPSMGKVWIEFNDEKTEEVTATKVSILAITEA